MFKKDNATRDTFSLGLGGMTVITSFAAVPAIACDRLYQVRENRPQIAAADGGGNPSLWLSGLYRAARGTFA
jgi:hypothetical protein